MRIIAAIILLFVVSTSGVIAETAAERSILLVRQGTAALLRSKFERAIEAYDGALGYDKLSPIRKASIHSDRGVAYWRLKKSEQALADFDQAIAINPEYPQVYNNKGNVLMDLNRHKEAVAAFSKAIELAPTYGVAYNNRGGAYYELGSIQEAISDFSTAIKYLPLNAVPHNGRGRSFLSKNQNYAALRDFERAVKLNSNYGMIFLSRARAYSNIEEYKNALKSYTRAISVVRDVPLLYLERGRAYQKRGDYATAISDYSKVIDLAPGHAEAFSLRGLCFGLMKKYKKGLSDIERGIELDPTTHTGFLSRGKINKRLKNYDQALEDFKLVLEMNKEHAETLKLIAQIHEIRNNKEEAIAFYTRSLASDRFLGGSREGLKRLTGTLPTYEGEPIGEPVSGWTLSKLPNGKYYIYHVDYPYLYGLIERYGDGEPRLIAWERLKGAWKGFAVLRYHAGTKMEREQEIPLEYAAIFNMKTARLAAIEPDKWGKRSAKWKWGNGRVTVTDPDGGISEVNLKKPSKRLSRSQQTSSSDASNSDNNFIPSPWGDIRNPTRRTATRKSTAAQAAKRKERRRNQKSILDWLFQ